MQQEELRIEEFPCEWTEEQMERFKESWEVIQEPRGVEVLDVY